MWRPWCTIFVLVKILNITVTNATIVVAIPDAMSAGWSVAPLPRVWPGGGSAIYTMSDAIVS